MSIPHHIPFTEGNNYIIVSGAYDINHKFTKNDSCYVKTKVALPDYHKRERAEEVAKFYNSLCYREAYFVVEVKE